MLNRIITGDACVELCSLPTGLAQAIIAAPPYYNILKEDWDTQGEEAEEYLEWSLVFGLQRAYASCGTTDFFPALGS